MMYDFHTHLSSDFSSFDDVFSIISTSTKEEFLLASTFKNAFVSFGPHPWHAKKYSKKMLAKCLRKAQVIGEIGLDNVWCATDPSLQEKCFRFALKKAQKYQKPIVLHTKGKEKEVLDIITNYKLSKIIVHWFDCDDLVDDYLKIGCFFTIGPDYKSRRDFISLIPLDKILIETDGIEAIRWCANTINSYAEVPSFLYQMYQFIADVKGVSMEILKKQIELNFFNALNLD